MEDPDQIEDVALEAGDSVFLEHSYFTYTVPFGTGVDAEEVVKNAIAEKQPLEDIEARPWLFFGTDASVVVLPGSSSVSQYLFIDAR